MLQIIADYFSGAKIMKNLISTLLALSSYYCTAFGRCQVETENAQRYRQNCDYDYCENAFEKVAVRQDISCYDTSISMVQETVSADLKTTIIITDSSIEILAPNSQYKWEQLEEFRMLKTNTSEIIPGFFNSFNNLLELQIVKNNVKQLTSGVFSPLFALKHLNLSENVIETVAPHSFSGLSNLEILDLSKNRISVLPPNIFEYQIVLSHVDISKNNLSNIGNIFSSDKISFLNVSHNYLIDINISQFHVLTILDCSFNMIENVVANGTSDYSVIEQIYLSYNKISKLPKIENIRYLNISHNSIHSIDTDVLGDKIISLDISHNHICNVTTGAFQKSINLQYLYFDHNNLTSLSIDIFYNLLQLEYLDLSSNQIKQIPFGCFNDLGNLTYLDLSDNNMNLQFHTFSTLKSLNTLKFQNNKVVSFDLNTILLHFKKLKYITLNDNSWNCSGLASVIQQLQLNNISFMRGQNTNVSNILGISCTDDTFLKEDIISIKRTNEKSNNKEIVYSVPAESIDNIMKNTKFFKYLQTIAEYVSKNISNDLNVFGGKNVKNTTFFKLMNNFATNTSNSIRDIALNVSNFTKNMNESSSNSANKLEANLVRFYNGNERAANETQKLMYKQNDILEQILAKNASNINLSTKQNEILSNINRLLLLNLKSTPVAEIKPVESSAALIGEPHDVDTYKAFNYLYLIINNILLVIIVCCILLLGYGMYFKLNLMPVNSNQEQVQLM
ncbi:unnamed protein product [Ceutorhynchus assimilis]|uniref:Uncharacterized protein n=1 Tax=Ceutorhynchus assimilis TaxID=467358 RepID=A0A9N9MX46_9CUCU|nr:unnamed protein product [Ceutorhynchus assimilis]